MFGLKLGPVILRGRLEYIIILDEMADVSSGHPITSLTLGVTAGWLAASGRNTAKYEFFSLEWR
jgi:hypothetical protein